MHLEVLENGLTVLVQRDATAPVVATVLYVKAGYFDEPDEWVGISHVLEHMFFKGTRLMGPGDLAKEIKGLGGYVNAGTIYDHTSYYAVFPSEGENWRRALEIQADALMNCALDAAELESELEVIVQEANRKLDNASAVTLETMYSALFPEHPMGRWRIGTEEQLRRLGRSDLEAYYQSRYHPANTIVAIVGDIDADEAACFAAKLFGGWKNAPADSQFPIVSDSVPSPAMITRRGDVQRAMAAVGWRGVPEGDEHAPAMDVAAAILSAGRGSWLYRGLRTSGLVNTVSASHYTTRVLGVFNIFIQGDPKKFKLAVGSAIGLVKRLAEVGPSDSDMKRVFSLLATRRARSLESMDTRASTLCHYEAHGGAGLVDVYWERLNSVTPADVMKVARICLNPLAPSSVFYLPVGADQTIKRWPPEAVLPAVSSLSVDAAVVSTSSTRGTGQPLALPPGTSGESFGGSRFVFAPRRGTGVCVVGAFFSDLPMGESEETAGLTTLLTRASLRGAAGRSGASLAEAAELLGGTISQAVSRQYAGWTVAVRFDNVQDAVELLSGVAIQPSLDEKQVANEKEQQLADARKARDDMFGHPVREALRAGFDGTSYGLPLIGLPESVAGFTVPQLREWSDRLISSPSLVVGVGDLESGPALRQMKRSWGLPDAPEADTRISGSWRAGSMHENRDKEQTAIAMAFPGVAFEHQDRAAVRVLCAVLSGMGGRLFDALREKRSLAYTVSAIPWHQKHLGAVVTYIATSPDQENLARDQMLEELSRLVGDGVSNAELERARTFVVGQEKMKLQSSGSILSELVQYWGSGDLKNAGGFVTQLQEVSKRDVNRVAGEVFLPDLRSEYVVRGKNS